MNRIFHEESHFQIERFGHPGQRQERGIAQTPFNPTDFGLRYVRSGCQVSLAYSQLMPAVGKLLSDPEAFETGLSKVIAGSSLERANGWRVASPQFGSQFLVRTQFHFPSLFDVLNHISETCRDFPAITS